jgi:tripartite ATP-independent transporter DctP family solute receptor
MKKIIFGLVFLAAAGMLFAGGGSQGSETGGGTAAKPLELITTTVAPSTDPHAQGLVALKETVERLSGGTIRIINYDSASLFKQEQEPAAVRSGQVDFVSTAPAWLTELSPWVSMFTAGYMFQTYEHLRKFYDSPAAQEVFERVAREQGIRPLGADYLGTRQINLVEDRQIRTPADLRGVNLRMPNSESFIFLGRALGANPTPISFSEIYMALQTRTIDGQENPLLLDKNSKFYEVTKSITLTNHVVACNWICINEKRWQSLTPQQQGWVMEGVKAGIKRCDEMNLKAEAELVQFFKDAGLKVYDADLKAFSSHVLDQYLKSDMAKTWDMDLFKKVQDMAQ